ncbi:MAG: nucleotidyltransferase family protein [Clostridiales bacterium]|jgi:D-glycero-alpha-D-manno-heptose 1-phosphate guanylyltransferase|nr:nucleotidyltransferase family protein [Eubacteriales bacterium]MDH7566502.1 nucleotidyltransferase family protein [Clostridiales bacterium]
MQALVLAGGLGTRLRSVVRDRPKPMVSVNDRPFLEYIIKYLAKQDVKNIVLCTGYLGYRIREHFKDGSPWGCRIQYSEEEEPLGTGGALKLAEKYISEDDFFVLNGDTFLELDYGKMLGYHRGKKSQITVALVQTKDTRRYGSIVLGEGNRIGRFLEKNSNGISGFINAGVYIFQKGILDHIQPHRKISLESELLPYFINNHSSVYGYKSKGYFIDIGIPETYYKSQEDFKGR